MVGVRFVRHAVGEPCPAGGVGYRPAGAVWVGQGQRGFGSGSDDTVDCGAGCRRSLDDHGVQVKCLQARSTWATEATHPAVDAVVPGTVTFEWLEGDHFLLARSSNEHEFLPDSLQVIGTAEAGDKLVMEYFDSRGVRRTYGVSLRGDVLRFWRDASGFDQRFSAKLGHNSFEGLWQLARRRATGGTT
jgi:hypothetical protein